MTVIGPERLMITTDRKGKPIQLGGFDEADYYASRACVAVEYVRSDLHAGAVDALKRIAYNGDWWSERHAGPLARKTLDEMDLGIATQPADRG